MLTLWDLIKHRPKSRNAQPAKANSRRAGMAPKLPAPPKTQGKMALRYEEMTRAMLAEYGVRVRKWRTSMSGVAWQVTYHDGTVARLIEAPRPRGPMSAAVFLHEIGHHAIGFRTYSPRCLEEYHAWAFALEQMHRWDLNVTDSVRRRMHASLSYAVHKALRRGLLNLPPELIPFQDPPAPRAPAAKTPAPITLVQ